MGSSRRQHRCAICRHGFRPNPRVGDRQRVCSKPECKQEFRRRIQAAWRERHPGYFIKWRARKRTANNASEPVDPPRPPAPLSALPWEMAQEEFGVAGADFLGSMGRLLLFRAKDEMPAQFLTTTGEFAEVAPPAAKDEMRGQPLEATGESTQVATPVAKDEIQALSG